jgi:hypothetical protein
MMRDGQKEAHRRQSSTPADFLSRYIRSRLNARAAVVPSTRGSLAFRWRPLPGSRRANQ